MTSELFRHSLARSAAVLSTDFCPWANRWVYWLKNPFWVLLLAVIGSFLCGVFLNPWIFVLTALLTAVAGVGAVVPWIAMRGVTCQVMFDVRRVRYGEAALVRLQIHNRWPIPVWGLSLIRGFTSRPAADVDHVTDSDDGIAFARVPGWSTMEYTWRFVARRRGVYPVDGVAEVETSFPFGLFRARRRAAVVGQLIVWPETTSLAGLPDAAESPLCEEMFTDRRAGEFGDMLGTRPFRHGDSLRRVHWAQTARQQSLIVTERQAPLMASVRIVLELPESSGEIAEQCIRVTASLVESLHRQHCRIELQMDQQLFIVSDQAAGLQRAMDALAMWEAVAPDHEDRQNTASHGRRTARLRSGDFTITVTHANNAIPGRRRQIVVTEQSTGETQSVSPAWISIGTTDALNHLASAWRKLCHD